jgi:GDP/UDP-N,N'-diacetylbacillosamine 2-epimerase (hydrolysing)
MERAGVERAAVLFPNNDPGWRGIAGVLRTLPRDRFDVMRNLPRAEYLRSLASAAMLIGNSSSGIIEAASLGTMVVNVGDRQKGRERSANVIDVPWSIPAITKSIKSIWNNGKPKRFTRKNVYGGGDAGRRIAAILADVDLADSRLRRKLIRY